MERTQLEMAIGDVLSAYGIPASEEQLGLLALHLQLVIERNKVLNLTRIEDEEEGVVLHVLDSLLLLSSVNEVPRGELVDIGTGAGYPGIPLAIMTGRPVLLIDSVGKKVKAVDDFVRELGLVRTVEACQIRAEELARERGARFVVVTARAVAKLNVLVEYAAPLLVMGGRLVATKGQTSDEELGQGDAAAGICGLRRVSRETFELPEGQGHREIISYEKVSAPRIKLPRNVGMAKHHPLGM